MSSFSEDKELKEEKQRQEEIINLEHHNQIVIIIKDNNNEAEDVDKTPESKPNSGGTICID